MSECLKRELLVLFFFIILLVPRKSNAQIYSNDFYYDNALSEISFMLDEEEISFKRAVFLVENAFYEDKLSYNQFLADIKGLSNLSKKVASQIDLKYEAEDKNTIKVYASIFSLMTDTLAFDIPDSKDKVLSYPYKYDFDDVFGKKSWDNMFVSKLIATRSGNCHSLPYLYKILVEELGETAHLALAPNHIYIKHYSKKTGWYNTELTSASFPIDAWLMASGYVHMDAIRNEVYMDTLSKKESLALNLLDLAQGYERKFGIQDGEFILKAATKALEVNPNFINALLLKAETQKKLFEDKMLMKSIDDPNILMQQDEEARDLFLEMQSIYVKIHQLGYRQMPEEMYLDWLATLQEEREKYENKDIPVE